MRGNRVRKTLLLLLNERDSVGRHKESDSEICCSEEMGMLLLPLKLPGCYYRKPLHKERRDLWREQGWGITAATAKWEMLERKGGCYCYR